MESDMKLVTVAVLSLLGSVLLVGCAATRPDTCPPRAAVAITDHGCRDVLTGRWVEAACCRMP